ncbi:Zinc finger protein [Smittium culicis]|uniref:Zinc finger protein n=1 Tax=Smittium culicis TaxID=133412 RepID=A0A1R1Y0M0_9FUNG|nr:Zinc finger protein [Smittium culicis]OMJ18019.1 Zinc finger protein [Smittium culicis]OMJ20491.1 Zinc finger protein [Smittium culicis]
MDLLNLSPDSIINFLQDCKSEPEDFSTYKPSNKNIISNPSTNDLLHIIQEKLLSLPPTISPESLRDNAIESQVESKKRNRNNEHDVSFMSQSPSSKQKTESSEDFEELTVKTENSSQKCASEKVVQRYNCKYCTKSFTRPSSLTIHTYTHTGEKPHECTFPECKKRFSVLSNLRRHLKLHKNRHSAFLNQSGYSSSRGLSTYPLRPYYYNSLRHLSSDPDPLSLMQLSKAKGQPILPKCNTTQSQYRNIKDSYFYPSNNVSESSLVGPYEFSSFDSKKTNSIGSIPGMGSVNQPSTDLHYADLSKSYISNTNKIVANPKSNESNFDVTKRDFNDFGILDFKNNNIFDYGLKASDYRSYQDDSTFQRGSVSSSYSNNSGIRLTENRISYDTGNFSMTRNINNPEINKVSNYQVPSGLGLSTELPFEYSKPSYNHSNFFQKKYLNNSLGKDYSYDTFKPLNSSSGYLSMYRTQNIKNNLRKSISNDNPTNLNLNSYTSNYLYQTQNPSYPLSQITTNENQWYGELGENKFFTKPKNLSSLENSTSFQANNTESINNNFILNSNNQKISYPQNQANSATYCLNSNNLNSSMYL